MRVWIIYCQIRLTSNIAKHIIRGVKILQVSCIIAFLTSLGFGQGNERTADLGVSTYGIIFESGSTAPHLGVAVDINKAIASLIDKLTIEGGDKDILLATFKVREDAYKQAIASGQSAQQANASADAAMNKYIHPKGTTTTEVKEALEACTWTLHFTSKHVNKGRQSDFSIKYKISKDLTQGDQLVLSPVKGDSNYRELIDDVFEISLNPKEINDYFKAHPFPVYLNPQNPDPTTALPRRFSLDDGDIDHSVKGKKEIRFVTDKDLTAKVDSPLSKIKLLTVTGGVQDQSQATHIGIAYGKNLSKSFLSILKFDDSHFGTFDVSSTISTAEVDSEAVTKLSWDVTMTSTRGLGFATRYVSPTISFNQTFSRLFVRSEWGFRFGDKRATGESSDTPVFFAADKVFQPFSFDLGVLGGVAYDYSLSRIPRISNASKSEVLGITRVRFTFADTATTGLTGTSTGYFLPRSGLNGGAPANLRWAYDAQIGVFFGPKNNRFSATYSFGYNIDNNFATKSPSVKLAWTRKF